LCGFDVNGDDRQFRVVNYHIPALKKNVSTSLKRADGELHCVTCKVEHSFSGNEPFADQCFPPSLPTDEKRCVVVIRLEDCLLYEQPGLLKEFFGNRAGYLPEGSTLVFGSISHLSTRGLENYLEETVKMYKVFSNMLARGCSVAHYVPVPLGGVWSEALVRDIYDLDSWLRNNAFSNQAPFPKSREKFWEIVRAENHDEAAGNSGTKVLFLPVSLENSKKIRTVSGSVDCMPEKIKPISGSGEKLLIETIMTELNEDFAMTVTVNPDLD
jgi:hypothetical protein